jgi:hypothetical protein
MRHGSSVGVCGGHMCIWLAWINKKKALIIDLPQQRIPTSKSKQ